MKKRTIVAGLFFFANLVPPAVACNNPPNNLTGGVVSTLLETAGRIACYRGAVVPPTWTNQEIHASGGVLRDYKRGPTNGVDPTTTVGRYTIATSGSRNGIITYFYAGGPTLFYFIQPQSGSPTDGHAGMYNFCPNATGTGLRCTFSIPVNIETSASSGCS